MGKKQDVRPKTASYLQDFRNSKYLSRDIPAVCMFDRIMSVSISL